MHGAEAKRWSNVFHGKKKKKTSYSHKDECVRGRSAFKLIACAWVRFVCLGETETFMNGLLILCWIISFYIYIYFSSASILIYIQRT